MSGPAFPIKKGATALVLPSGLDVEYEYLVLFHKGLCGTAKSVRCRNINEAQFCDNMFLAWEDSEVACFRTFRLASVSRGFTNLGWLSCLRPSSLEPEKVTTCSLLMHCKCYSKMFVNKVTVNTCVFSKLSLAVPLIPLHLFWWSYWLCHWFLRIAFIDTLGQTYWSSLCGLAVLHYIGLKNIWVDSEIDFLHTRFHQD